VLGSTSQNLSIINRTSDWLLKTETITSLCPCVTRYKLNLFCPHTKNCFNKSKQETRMEQFVLLSPVLREDQTVHFNILILCNTKTLLFRVTIEDCPQKSNFYGIWSAKGSVLDIKNSTQARESPGFAGTEWLVQEIQGLSNVVWRVILLQRGRDYLPARVPRTSRDG